MNRNQLGFETEFLIIREFTINDYDALYNLTRQREITDLLPDWNMTKEQLSQFLRFVVSSYETFHPENVRVLLAIVHKKNQHLIGWVGVFPNEMLEEEDREIAYAISKDYRNQGHMTEAVQGMVNQIFKLSKLERIVAIVKPHNRASRRVVEKLGFIYLHTLTLKDNCSYDYFIGKRE